MFAENRVREFVTRSDSLSLSASEICEWERASESLLGCFVEVSESGQSK